MDLEIPRFPMPDGCALFTLTSVVGADVDKIVIDGTDDEGPAYRCVGHGITLRAIPDPPETNPFCPAWDFTAKPAGSEVPDPPPGATATITPDKPGTYTIRAACGASSDTFTLHAVKVEITNAADVVLTDPQTTIVGKKINLKGKITPAVTPDEQLWEIAGSAIKDYTQTLAQGEVDELEASDLNGSQVEFYWIACEASAEVKYTATFNGVECSATVSFEVKRPTATLTSTITPLEPPTDIRDDQMRFGELVVGNEGITWNAEATTPVGGAGQIAFVQLWKANRRGTQDNDDMLKWTSEGEFYLDRIDNSGDLVQYGSAGWQAGQ